MDRLAPFDKIGVTPVPDHQNADPANGIQGSILNVLIFNQLQREGVNLEALAGLTPSSADLTQWAQAVSRGGIWVGNLTGTGDIAVATLGAVLPALLQGMRVAAVATAANTVINPKLRVTNLGTIGGYTDFQIVKEDGSTLSAGDIKAGRRYRFEADGAGNVAIALDASSTLGSRFVAGRVPYRFTSPGSATLSLPAGRTADMTEVRGAGGGGGGSSSSSYAAAGGGGGGRAQKVVTALTDTVLAITNGAPGVAGTAGGGDGSAGGTTSVAVQSGSVVDANGTIFTAGQTICAATGGGGGKGAAGTQPVSGAGAGGVASGGDLNDSGNVGNYSVGGNNGGQLQGGLGGSSPGSAPPGPNLNSAGATSTDPGSGGSGASANAAGGPGSPGRVTIYK